MTEEENNELKISIPLITNQELESIDNMQNEFIKRVSEVVYKDKEMLILQRLIQNQEDEIEKKDKIIDEMAKWIASQDIDEEICSTLEKDCDQMAYGECEACIKQYFENKIAQ